MRRVLRWRDWSGDGLEHAELAIDASGVSVESVVIGGAGADSWAIAYRLLCDAGWRLREAEFRAIGAERRLLLHADGEGNWRDGEGHPLDQLRGAVDIDISATPFTNTLPIRRLRLPEGAASVIRVAFVETPSLTVDFDEQRYTRLSATTYRFESLRVDFRRDITVDEDGFVVDYPGLFRRAP